MTAKKSKPFLKVIQGGRRDEPATSRVVRLRKLERPDRLHEPLTKAEIESLRRMNSFDPDHQPA